MRLPNDSKVGRLFIRTFGCQMNRYDSERLVEILGKHQWELVEDYRQADLIFINTCTVRDKAEQKAFSYLGRLKPLKRSRPDLVVALGGCVAQQHGEELLRRLPHLDLVVGTHSIREVPAMIARYETTGERQASVGFSYDFGDEVDGRSLASRPEVSAYVTIMRGCDNFCTYCIVPIVRGREVSRPSKEIIREVESLVERGVRAVTLLGQNVNSYGLRVTGEPDFAGLLRLLARVEGLLRIRFTTSHPKDLSSSLMHCFADLEPLCPHIHLPVQSGSDPILQLMKRGYTRAHYLQQVRRLRAIREDVAISSDMIVGFPGEGEDDFQQTLSLMEEVSFESIFSFKYSDRPQTAASRLGGKVPEEVKLRRLQTLQSLQERLTMERNKAQVGEISQVLVEGPSQAGGSQLSGRTPHNRVVNFLGTPQLVGEELPVLITAAHAHSLEGVVCVKESSSLHAVKERSWCGK
ncbi:MAG: tRNA (N6-isopentenyl adenosine(37)-C2)-methylthiotransferase MiaB [Deltaproteobacteria bacterium]|nr:MAG: tRNA (N6-isopentenyl adenosine(37)-C2)-methylthiotransferase MiaB [Deltaproteobacteria bacterium]